MSSRPAPTDFFGDEIGQMDCDMNCGNNQDLPIQYEYPDLNNFRYGEEAWRTPEHRPIEPWGDPNYAEQPTAVPVHSASPPWSEWLDMTEADDNIGLERYPAHVVVDPVADHEDTDMVNPADDNGGDADMGGIQQDVNPRDLIRASFTNNFNDEMMMDDFEPEPLPDIPPVSQHEVGIIPTTVGDLPYRTFDPDQPWRKGYRVPDDEGKLHDTFLTMQEVNEHKRKILEMQVRGEYPGVCSHGGRWISKLEEEQRRQDEEDLQDEMNPEDIDAGQSQQRPIPGAAPQGGFLRAINGVLVPWREHPEPGVATKPLRFRHGFNTSVPTFLSQEELDKVMDDCAERNTDLFGDPQVLTPEARARKNKDAPPISLSAPTLAKTVKHSWLYFDFDFFVKNYEPRNKQHRKGTWQCPVLECQRATIGKEFGDKEAMVLHWAERHRADKAAGALLDNSDGTLSTVAGGSVPLADRGDYDNWRRSQIEYWEFEKLPLELREKRPGKQEWKRQKQIRACFPPYFKDYFTGDSAQGNPYAAAAGAPQTPSSLAPALQTRYDLARPRCYACAKNRLVCDKELPCSNCVRTWKVCNYGYEPIPSNQRPGRKAQMLATQSPSSPIPIRPTPTTLMKTSCEPCCDINDNCEGGNPCTQCQLRGIQEECRYEVDGVAVGLFYAQSGPGPKRPRMITEEEQQLEEGQMAKRRKGGRPRRS